MKDEGESLASETPNDLWFGGSSARRQSVGHVERDDECGLERERERAASVDLCAFRVEDAEGSVSRAVSFSSTCACGSLDVSTSSTRRLPRHSGGLGRRAVVSGRVVRVEEGVEGVGRGADELGSRREGPAALSFALCASFLTRAGISRPSLGRIQTRLVRVFWKAIVQVLRLENLN